MLQMNHNEHVVYQQPALHACVSLKASLHHLPGGSTQQWLFLSFLKHILTGGETNLKKEPVTVWHGLVSLSHQQHTLYHMSVELMCHDSRLILDPLLWVDLAN